MFRRKKVNKKLSADELKSKLYAHFDKSGSLNQLRTQIRSQLASDLFKNAPTSTVASEHNKTVDLGSSLLPLQVCNWLVYDHLIRQGYQYTLSTFVSETNLPYPEKLLAVGDILALVGLDNNSSEYKKISDLYSNEKEGLHSLLLAIIKSIIFISDKDNQPIENVMNSSLEVGTKNKLPTSSEKHVLFETLEKPSRIKEFSVASSLESSYYDQLQSIREERDKEIQNVRHKLVQELERLHLQEQSLHQEIEQERREIKKERDLLFCEREKWKVGKDLFIKEQENKLEKKLREVEDIHIAKLHSKDKEIAALHNELREGMKKLEHVEVELSTHREELIALKQELDDANKMYKSVHEKYNSLLDENTNLVRKFERMSDYNILKEELIAKKRDITNLQHEIENLHRTAERDKNAYIETVTSLELKLKATEPKLQHLQKELSQTKNILDMEETMWQKEKKRLEQDSLTSQKQYQTVLQRIEEQKQDIHDLHQTIHILHYQLTSGNINQSAKLDIQDPLRTIPKTPFLPLKNKQILKSNKNDPSTISQHYREQALDFTSNYKSRLNKLQQAMNEDFEKYSLIHHTSFDFKMPNIKPSLSQNSPVFTHNMKFHQPSFAKNSSSMPFSLQFDTSKSLMELGNLNIKYGGVTVPNFMNKNNLGGLSETLTSSQSIYDSTKTFVADSNVTSAAPKNIYDGVFSSQSEQALKASEILIPSSLTNKRFDKDEEFENFKRPSFLPSRKDNDAIKPVEHFSSEIVTTASTGLRDNVSKDIPHTGNIVDNITSFTNSTNMSLQRSVLLPVTSNKFSFQNLDDSSTDRSIDRIPRDTHSSITVQNKFDVTETNGSISTETVKTVSIGLTENVSKDISITETPIIENAANFPIIVDAPLQRSFQLPTATNKLSFHTDDNTEQSVVLATRDTGIPLTSSGSTASIDPIEQPEIAPIVVDLDAAWKRKTSIPGVNPPLLKNSNPLRFSTNINPVEPYSEGETKQSITVSSHSDVKPSKIESCTIAKSDTETPSNVETSGNISSSTAIPDTIKNSEQYKELSRNQEDMKEKELVAVPDVSGTDEETKEKKSFYKSQMQDAMKHTPEDSLSELSEVHMSCGSEQEEQKEESDNW